MGIRENYTSKATPTKSKVFLKGLLAFNFWVSTSCIYSLKTQTNLLCIPTCVGGLCLYLVIPAQKTPAHGEHGIPMVLQLTHSNILES